MMLYLTGASVSLAKTSEAPQTDINKSLGGYISSSPVPNGGINVLFDAISLNSLKTKTSEVIALGLVNKFQTAVRNVKVKIITSKDSIGKFSLAAVQVGGDYLMEHIDSRYSEPIQAEFHDIDFYRSSVEAEIKQPGIAGEFISFQPFDVTAEITKPGIEGTMEAIIRAFSVSEYEVVQISKSRFNIVSRGDEEIDVPWECSALATEHASVEFLGSFANGKTNEALLADSLPSNGIIGLWLKRDIQSVKITNEEILARYNEGYINRTQEDIELVVSYDEESDIPDEEEPNEPEDPNENNEGNETEE